jgi:hypothetical protein
MVCVIVIAPITFNFFLWDMKNLARGDTARQIKCFSKIKNKFINNFHYYMNFFWGVFIYFYTPTLSKGIKHNYPIEC